MKIEGNNPLEGKELYKSVHEINRGEETDKKASAHNEVSQKDKISLSGRAREISELKALIEELPDIRTDRVEELKKTVDTGNYNIDSLKIAEKILEEI